MAAAASPPASEPKKPAVVIVSTGPVPEDVLAPILWGMEEEGIPVELLEAETGVAEHLAKSGADGSPLGVGIGIQGEGGKAALHHRDLPIERPLFVLGSEELTASTLRLLGMNAARLVKGEPLVFSAASMNTGDEARPEPTLEMDMEQLVQLITQVVLELIQERNSGR